MALTAADREFISKSLEGVKTSVDDMKETLNKIETATNQNTDSVHLLREFKISIENDVEDFKDSEKRTQSCPVIDDVYEEIDSINDRLKPIDWVVKHPKAALTTWILLGAGVLAFAGEQTGLWTLLVNIIK